MFLIVYIFVKKDIKKGAKCFFNFAMNKELV